MREFINYVRTSFHSTLLKTSVTCFLLGIIVLAIIPYAANKGKRNECKGKNQTQPIHVPTAIQSRGDLLVAKCSKLLHFSMRRS